MSSIEKLSICGIRSFYPGRAESIEFNQPLTVILGANGCGKTTIIECLKISCTGSLPPSARSGQSFIHDPKIRGDVEVKANIRLRFKSRAGQTMVVQRTFRLQQMKSTCKYQALDGVVRMLDKHGKKLSINQKCGELDKHIPDLLGVSAAVLESVIFCHQEESNWPLQEGIVLKKRFDDIFESARYTKALDAIKKLKKDRVGIAKDMKRDLDVLAEQVSRVREMEEQLEEQQAKLESLQADYAQLSSDIDLRETRVHETEAALGHVRSVLDQLRAQEAVVKQKSDEITRVYQQMGREMAESTESLEEILANYDSILAIKRKEVQDLSTQESQLQDELASVDQAERKLAHEKGVLEATMAQQKEAMRARTDLATKLGSTYGIAAAVVTQDDARIFASRLQDVLAQLGATLKRLEADARRGDDEWNAKQTTVSAKVHHCHETLGAKTRELSALKRKEDALVAELNTSSGGLDASQREWGVVEARLADAEAKLSALRESATTATLKEDILALEKEANSITFDLRALDDKLQILRTFERDQIALEHKRNEHTAKRKALETALASSQNVLESPLSFATLSDDRNRVETLVFELKRSRETSSANVAKLEREMAEAQVKKRTDEGAIAKTRTRYETLSNGPMLEWKTLLATFGLQPETALTQLEAQYLDAKDKTQSRKNTIVFLRTYMKKGEKDHCCPLCQRGLSPDEETLFSQLIANKMDDSKNQEKIAKAERNESAALDAWKRCEKLQPLYTEFAALEASLPTKTTELESLYTTIRMLDVQLQEAKATHAANVTRSDDAAAALKQLTSLQTQWEELSFVGHRLDGDDDHLLSEKTIRLGANPPTLVEAQAARDAKQTGLQDSQSRLKRLQRELQLHQETQQGLQNEVHKCREEKAAIQQRRVDVEKAREAREGLRVHIKALQDEVATLQRDLPGYQRELQQCKNEQLLARDTHQRAIATAREASSRCENDKRQYDDKSKHADQFARQNLDGRALELTSQMQSLQAMKAEKARRVEQIQPEKSSALRALDENVSLKRQIDDNLSYRRLQAELQQAKAAVLATQRQLGQLPSVAEAERLVADAKNQCDATREERAVFRGKQEALQEAIRNVQLKLHGRDLKNIDEKQRCKLIDYETTMMAVSDLDKYYKALDLSLMEFHSKKIEEINAIIRTLWQITYRGNDIDTIELVSGQESGAAARAGRSYNYRVVMRKDNTLLDMRGRCSAGQKVLAALVIRLALAETFCLNCGILALDEPTTNLDSANKLGLAQAIADILKARENQHNFQLICITHDEEFVQMLNRSQLMGGTRPEYFWTVSREEILPRYYCSKIEKRNWNSDVIYRPNDDI
ncbi:hypothetical protein SDRG_01171 [Saprolegnia diclina VS20]|uniref:DNA repair protein RAD50 n=1 Tax=Saprolegnia diclina (strain VS20) TaxID=1156394 RepID=T0R4B9_SAPDV|nr:hypothetical protein SDRG_01171 [Saprolegnia diclina VS20]EQC41195.1 hypothetical protein SDRG_01171 [Saprolegnia diclina VS20]|eukprot:XP_008604909.1 hypothetical protein SDRG_01171 [Saprolegnia diclina VS20]